MAHDIQLPCDGDGVCMRCKAAPPAEETLTCCTCVTPWHVSCLSSRPETLASALQWECPDCSGDAPAAPADAAVSGAGSELLAAIREIESDQTLTDREKAVKRQELMGGKVEVEDNGGNDMLDVFDESFKCAFCMQLPERPVTTPCGHNFCLKCFQRWVGQRKTTCAKCRSPIPHQFASQPRINAAVVAAIRMARLSKTIVAGNLTKVYHFVHNQDKPDQAYTTERAKKTGKANAASGKVFVTIPSDYLGPIPADYDPVRNQGLLVGETWEDRLECRQWGAHFPHVAGIAGQASYGAQSVALSGGYVDDEDHGEWFLYTGSGGRDLSGNKRTNKKQAFDQTFEKLNEALRVSCKKGYPVRVVRSHKEKRSSYPPESGVRYDGVYRIEKCWRKVGIQGFKVCRYLFVRCDNEPAPWTSAEHGDRPRPLPVIRELASATDVTERKGSPAWDFDEQDGLWKWKIPPPPTRKPILANNPEGKKRSRSAITKAQNMNLRERLLKEFSCPICKEVMTNPVTTPCAHNFCKSCLVAAFAGQSLMRERGKGGRSLRAQKNILPCPRCTTNISDFLENPKVNHAVLGVIERLQREIEAEAKAMASVEEGEENNSEENPSAENMETGDNTSENSAEVAKPPAKKPRRAYKKRKVDEKADEKENNSEENPSTEHLETGDNASENSADVAKPSAKKPRRAYKKRKVDVKADADEKEKNCKENPSAEDVEAGDSASGNFADVAKPSAKKPRRTYKKRKVDEKADEKKENNYEENPSAKDMEAGDDASENPAEVVKHVADKRRRAYKKRKADVETDEKNKKKPRGNRKKKADVKSDDGNLTMDGNDSPSSPLTIRSSDDDFE